MTVYKIGDTVRIDRPIDEKVEWSNEDFARLFLHWLAWEVPIYGNAWVNVPDLEDHIFDRFRAAGRCPHVGDGALFRGLGKVTKKRERTYTDETGKRCTLTEYKVPKIASNVVEFAKPTS